MENFEYKSEGREFGILMSGAWTVALTSGASAFVYGLGMMHLIAFGGNLAGWAIAGGGVVGIVFAKRCLSDHSNNIKSLGSAVVNGIRKMDDR